MPTTTPSFRLRHLDDSRRNLSNENKGVSTCRTSRRRHSREEGDEILEFVGVEVLLGFLSGFRPCLCFGCSKGNDLLFILEVAVNIIIFLADQGMCLSNTKRTDREALGPKTRCVEHRVVSIFVI